jgi:hypothetical protein
MRAAPIDIVGAVIAGIQADQKPRIRSDALRGRDALREIRASLFGYVVSLRARWRRAHTLRGPDRRK